MNSMFLPPPQAAPAVQPGDLCERYALDLVKCDNQGTRAIDATIVPRYAGGYIVLCDEHDDLIQQVKDFKEALDKLPK